MSSGAPIEAYWNGQVFQPASSYWVRRADKEFVQGEVCYLVNQAPRSGVSHRHFFASVHQAWENLPPMWAERFQSAEALRKYALIKAGYCYSDSIVCASHAEALRFMSFVRKADDFALVEVKKNVVFRYVAKSQSVREMGAKDFQASKQAVLDILSDMIGVTAGELRHQGAA